LPKRVRTVLTLGLILGITGAVTGTLLDVYRAAGEPGFATAVSDAVRALIFAAVAGGALGAVVATLEQRAPRPSRRRERQSGRALAVVAAVAVIAGLAVFVSVKGSPFTVVSNAWHDFKTKPSPYGGASRFTGSLGTNRYDFWRVAWDRFKASPLEGDGSDNFQQAYLAVRRSGEAPRYPHSVELRALGETGLVGTGLLAVGVGAALWAALLAMRRRRGLGAAAAAAGAASFVYWLAHGTIDWFWEFPALGAPAFALLGLAAGLLPRPARIASAPVSLRGPRALLLVPVALAVLSLGTPWLSQLDQKKAVTSWRTDAAAAFRSLDTAASLNPLSATPKLLAGSIALRLGRKADSMRFFREAIEREPGDSYAHLELGALLAEAGRRPEAVATLDEAHRLDPRDDLTALVRNRVRRGKPVDIARVNRQLAARSARLGR
jgi:hypothetical protein